MPGLNTQELHYINAHLEMVDLDRDGKISYSDLYKAMNVSRTQALLSRSTRHGHLAH